MTEAAIGKGSSRCVTSERNGICPTRQIVSNVQFYKALNYKYNIPGAMTSGPRIIGDMFNEEKPLRIDIGLFQDG